MGGKLEDSYVRDKNIQGRTMGSSPRILEQAIVAIVRAFLQSLGESLRAQNHGSAFQQVLPNGNTCRSCMIIMLTSILENIGYFVLGLRWYDQRHLFMYPAHE